MADNRKKSFKEAQFVRFYNAGDRVSEPLSFSLPDHGDIHAVARWVLEAPEDDFFNVPQLLILSDGTKVNVDFPATVARKFGERGVIMIAPDLAPLDPDDETETNTLPFPEAQPFARDEEEATERGKEFWRSFLERIARNHINQCQQARAAGGWPVEATGFTKRALKLMGWQDPATMMMDQLKTIPGSVAPAASSAGDSRVSQLEGEVSRLTGLIEKLLASQSNAAQYEALKKEDAADAILAKRKTLKPAGVKPRR